jgi:alpha-amylase/alpha-mannosidase (GH57 family)
MHQPQYRDLIRQEYRLPWTYLHAIKDYVDMAAHLEAVAGAKAVVNFVPTLLEQITDYAEQVRGYLHDSVPIRDPLLAALADPVLPGTPEQRIGLMKACLRANEQHMIKRFRPYEGLVRLAAVFGDYPETMNYAADQHLVDLLVWYHLAWLGESVRRQDPRIQFLMRKAQGFSLHDRRELVTVIGESLSGVIGRYAELAARGQVELAVSPYAHPILPLLLDLQSAREAMPQVTLPALASYPGGAERARWQLQAAIDCFQRHFGAPPQGCWPSEGGLSTETVKLLGELGFRWTASGENVLFHSLAQANQNGRPREQTLFRAHRLTEGGAVCFFRDDVLSDLIGFTYSDWDVDDAVGDLVHNLENIADACHDQPGAVVSIILDGDNAWEYYPQNGYLFLNKLYQRLVEHPRFELTTFSACLQEALPTGELPQLVAGSWVYGTFSTWIGEPEKNRAWELLGDVKRAFDEVSPSLTQAQRAAVEQQLAVCEGSDWFWWFGGENPHETVAEFDLLYRMHLSNLYQELGLEPPEYLAHAFAHGGAAPKQRGTMRPGRSQA